MKTVLVVDDEKDILDLIKYNLEKEGYSVLQARNGRAALDLARQEPHLILLDIMLPEFDGLEVLRRLKKDEKTRRIPVVFLTAKGTDVDEVLGLELGADDYIVKPISIPKLTARIRTILRKEDEAARAPVLPVSVGPIEISPSHHTIRIHGKEIFFPKKEFEVLLYLAGRPGQVVDRETLLRAIWGTEVRVIDRTVDVHIRKIREKLGKVAGMLETIKGVGYRLREAS
jgi:two-component system alkaline phosphatase synthesis response regulator PhoP